MTSRAPSLRFRFAEYKIVCDIHRRMEDVALLIEDADVHGSGMKIDSAVVLVLLIIKLHLVLLNG
jgi:plasmid replication initiation protein